MKKVGFLLGMGLFFSLGLGAYGQEMESKSQTDSVATKAKSCWVAANTDPRGRGFYSEFNAGYTYQFGGIGMGDVQLIVGYQFSRYFGVGLGIADRSYETGGTFPFFVNLRSEFLKGKVTPFVSVNAGYNEPIKGSYNGVYLEGPYQEGLYLEPKVGVAFRVSPYMKVNVGLSYMINNTNTINTAGQSVSSRLEQGLRLSVGVIF